MKYFNFITFIFLIIFYLCNVTVAQRHNSYIQIDTINICEKPNSMVFIFKSDTSKISAKYFDRDMITTIEIFKLGNGLPVQKIIDTSRNYYDCWIDYVDINLDGYLDLDINLGYYNLIPYHSFWLYNKFKKEYSHSSEYSELNDYYLNTDKKEINSVEQFTGGRGGIISTYKIDDENLSLIKEVFIDIDSTTKVQIELYENIFDSLMVIEKKWLIEVQEIPWEMRTSDTYLCEDGRNMKYLKKELYKYQKINGEIISEVQNYKVLNNKWQLIK